MIRPALSSYDDSWLGDFEVGYEVNLANLSGANPVILRDGQPCGTDCQLLSFEDGVGVFSVVDRGSPHTYEIRTSIACAVDLDGDGLAGTSDLIAFLSRFFAGNGDVNNNGVTSVEDLFAFLSRWFAGC